MVASDIIFITFLNPFKEKADGGSQDIKRRIIALANQGYSVKVFAFGKKQEKEVIGVKNGNIKIKVYDRKINFFLAIQFKPFPIVSRFNKLLMDDLELELKKPIHALIVEGIQCMAVIKELPNSCLNKVSTILRVHNIEYKYYSELGKSSSNVLKKLSYFITSLQYKLIEKRFVDQFDNVHFISNLEFEEYNSKSGFKKGVFWVPPIVNKFPEFTREINQQEEFNLVYFGDLTVPLNFQGIKWFIDEIFSNLVEAFPYKLLIAGNGSEKLVKQKGIEAHGYVSDLSAFLSNADLIVLPILHGAGVKIKTIDSLAIGLPVIGSTVAFEGISENITQRCIIEDLPQGFINAIEDVRKNYNRYQEGAKIVQHEVLADFGPERYAKIVNQVNID